MITRAHLSLAATGCVQVALVALNTYQISRGVVLGTFVVGFLISFVWSWNVRRIAFGGMADRIAYATGAALGSVAGLGIGALLYGRHP